MIDAPLRASSTSGSESTPNALARLLLLGRPLIMGVLNVTPDSFSDGGEFFDAARARDHAEEIVAQGADILDIGAESSRPYGGALPVPLEEEIRRLEPVLPAAVKLGTPVSIDTMKSEVAAWALEAGACVMNDVWGLQRDPNMARTAAEREVPVIVMHNRQSADPSLDILVEIKTFFARSLEIAAAAGVPRQAIVLDPGIGFGKTPEQSLTAIAQLQKLRSFGLPLLVGASRKRFIAKVSPSPPNQRLGGSIAAHVLAVANGASIIRTHDVAETVQALRVAAAIQDRQ
jgi:dihydropteroate synthase